MSRSGWCQIPLAILAIAYAATCICAYTPAAEPAPPPPPDFFWKLELDAGAEPAPFQVELLPAGADSRALVARIGPDQAALLAGDRELASAKLAAPPKAVILASRGGVCRLVLDGAPVLRAETAVGLAARPAVAVLRGQVKVSELRRIAPERLLFEDGFSRAAGEAGPWARRKGNWESAAHFFAGMSANAGALRARFAKEPPPDPMIAGRTESRQTGLGVVLAPCGGALCVERIAGGSPAERAGLASGDMIVSCDGARVGAGFLGGLLGLGGGRALQSDKPIELSVLRPGERDLRSIRVTPGTVLWGGSRETRPLPGASAAPAALVLTGEDFWRPSRVEVSARSGGAPAGFGLAFAAEADGSAWVFRLRPVTAGAPWAAELVRVRPDGTDAGQPPARSEPGIPWPGSWYRLAVEICEDGRAAAPLVRCLVADREVLRTNLPSGGFGPVGLWAGGSDGWIEFDDFSAADDPAEAAGRALRPVSFPALLTHEPDMGSWAAAGSDWLLPDRPEAPAAWRFPCLSGAEVRIDPLPADGPLELTWSAAGPEGARAAACSARISPDGRVELLSGGRTAASARIEPGRPCTVRLAGGELSAASGGRVAARASAGDGVRDRLTAAPARAVLSGAVGVRPAGGIDLGFDRAPAELAAVAGVWGLTNKWVCDPRWSWYGARGTPLAAVWTLRQASGDQQVDAFAALMMQRMDPPFERAHDFGLALCGDGRSLWSGYTLVFGADGNRATRLYRRGALVAATDRESARFPAELTAGRDLHVLHQRWFRLTLARRGARVAFLLDGREELAWTDPEPLGAGRAAAWTFDNGMMLARLRLDAAQLGPAEPDLGAPGDARPAPGFEAAAGAGPPPRISSGPGGATRVEAVAGGGPLAVRPSGLTADPGATAGLVLRLRASEGAAVDLLLDGPGGRYRVGLLGPSPDPDAPEREVRWLGRADAGPAGPDGWREFSVPLGALWRDHWARRDPRQDAPSGPLRPTFGCPAEPAAAAMGLAANRPGAWYEVSPVTGTPAAGDREPPTVGELRLEPGTGRTRARLVLPLADPGGAGLNRRALRLELNGRALSVGDPGVDYCERDGRLTLDLAAAGARPAADGSWHLKLSGAADLAGNRAPDRELSAAGALASGADRRAPEKVRVRTLLGRAPLEGTGDERLDLPLDVGPERFQPSGGAGTGGFAALLPDEPGGPEGCEATALADGGSLVLQASPDAKPVDLARSPEIEFSYRVDALTPLAFSAGGNGFQAFVPLNDRPLPPNAFLMMTGRAPGARPVALAFRADGRWHQAALPLAEICRGHGAAARSLPLGSLRFGELRSHGARTGMHFALAGLRMVPAARPGELAFTWSAWDESGDVEVRSAFDQAPDTVPREALVEPGRSLAEKVRAGLQDGPAWLHLAFGDKAGNWSAPVHCRVLLDSSPPQAGPVRVTGQGLELTLSDATGIDPGTVRLTVNGREHRPGPNQALTYEPASGRVFWSARAALGRPLTNGEAVEYRLSAADPLGNATGPREAAAVRADFSADREAPTAPQVRSDCSGQTADPFDRDPGEAEALSPATRIEGALGPAGRGGAGLRLSKASGAAPLRARLRAKPWPAAGLPVAAFDLRAAAGARLELSAEISGHRVSAVLAGPGAPDDPPGAGAPGGHWRHVAVDLAALARTKAGALPVLVGRNLEIRELPAADGSTAAAGLRAEIANLELCRALPNPPRLVLESSDEASGVAGYAVVVDRRADTAPDRKVAAQTGASGGRASFRPDQPLEPGGWWVHVAAVDFAGNWSAPTHYRITVAPPPGQGAGAESSEGSVRGTARL